MNNLKSIAKKLLKWGTDITNSYGFENDGLIKLDLGGIGRGKHGWRTVNLVPGADIEENILNIDNYCQDNSVDIFKMSHTYEHIPIVKLDDFMSKIYVKLKKGGKLIIIQTDIKKTLELYKRRKIDFYCLRDVIFTSIDRRKESFKITSLDLQHHQFMWGVEELRNEILHYGFSKVDKFNAGSWNFDLKSVFPFQENEKYFGNKIPNLGIEAYK